MITEETDTPPTPAAPEAEEPGTVPAAEAQSDAPETGDTESVSAVSADVEAEESDVVEADDAPESVAEPAPPPKKRWYVIKVASNREESTKRNVERQIKIDNLEEFFGQIVIPVEEVVEVKKVTDTTKAGDKTTKTKKVIKKVKKFPGYIMAEVEWTPEVGAMLRGVSGVSGFVGEQGIGKPPPPMTDQDVQRMLGAPTPGGSGGDAPKKPKTEVVKLHFEKGDKVRIREGAFANFEGEVKAITEPKEAGEHPIVTVGVQVLGRETTIEMEFWQVDKL
jgi:transcriptional antiterminator NusG